MSEDTESDEPLVCFAGQWIPANEAWGKMEVASVSVDRIDQFNQRFPELSTQQTRDIVPLVRQRLKDIKLRMPLRAADVDLEGLAVELLAENSPEDVIAILAEEHGAEIGLHQLIQLAGESPYTNALCREGNQLAQNGISPDQTAELWQEARRPVPGGGLWTAKRVASLLTDA